MINPYLRLRYITRVGLPFSDLKVLKCRCENLITEMRPLIEINQQAINLLYKELGVVDAVRFLKQFTQGYGNYTQEREVIFAQKSLEEIVNDIEKRRKPEN